MKNLLHFACRNEEYNSFSSSKTRSIVQNENEIVYVRKKSVSDKEYNCIKELLSIQ